jgi:hypothetical protein
MICTTPECETSTQTFLCTQCVSDLQAWIDKAHVLLPDLDVTIARLDVTQPGNPETRSSNVAGSAAPANLDALQLKLNMESITHTADEYALMDHAAGTAWIIAEWCKSAEVLISGPEEPVIDHEANKERIKEIAPPMTTRQLLPWLRTNARIAITSQQIRHWAQRGHLKPVSREPSPTYWPHEVIEVQATRRDAPIES